MHAATLVFAPGDFNAEFHRLDQKSPTWPAPCPAT
jgi:hypothetical protein